MDIFGTALLRHYRAPSEAVITITRDDGWQDTHSPALYFTPEPFEFERPALEMVSGAVLDVGCGAGRHLKWLNAHRVEAHGVDVSPGAIEVCRARGIDSATLYDVMADDALPLTLAPQTIVLFGNNVGIGGSFVGSVQMMKNLHRICAKDGLMVLTGINVRQTENPQHLAYQERNFEAGRRRGEIRIALSYGGETGPAFEWYHPEPDEVEELAALSGWRVERLEPIGGFFWAALRRV